MTWIGPYEAGADNAWKDKSMLNIEGLQKGFALPDRTRLTVLDVPEFRIDAGEQVVLIGESGGGKTTLLHCVAGLMAPDSGAIQIDGIDVGGLSEAGRDRVRAAKIGYVFQTFNLLTGFTALENVRLGMTFASGRHDRQRAIELLGRVGLGDRMHHKPSALSVGQQQRVAVARALANRPRLLLADEPTANIDPANQQKIVDLLRDCCNEEGIAMLLVTHSMQVAEQFDRLERLEEMNRAIGRCTSLGRYRGRNRMSLFHIAWRNMQQRGLASVLTMFSMLLGVALVVLVLSISWIITESFDRNSNVGYNLIVGAKGGSLQLALNTVFYLSEPIEVIPYEEYLEFLPGESGRPNEIRKIGGRIAEPDRKGIFSSYTNGGFAIPVCLGDYFGPFRVVATKPEFFEKLRYGKSGELEYRFAAGRNFVDESPENGFYEAVLGYQVAREMQVGVGDTFQTTHGDPEGEGHGQSFVIVGVLEATGTPNDRATFINLEGFYLMEGHARAFEDLANPDSEKQDVEAAESARSRLPLEKRDLTAVLVKAGQPMFAVQMERPINKRLHTQAASPVKEITNMLNMFVNPVRNALLTLTVVVCVVSAISILVSIYNSMNERRRDIAVMRALGARRDVVLMVILLESLMIACVGGLLGWIAGHAIAASCSSIVEARNRNPSRFSQLNYFRRADLGARLGTAGNVGGHHSGVGRLSN